MLYNYLLEIQIPRNSSPNEIKTQNNGNYLSFSRKYPSLEVVLWCNYQHDILEIKGGEAELEEAQSDIRSTLGKIVKIFPESSRTQLILKRCRCGESSLSQILAKYECLELPPVNFFSGRMVLNLIVTSECTNLIVQDIREKHPDTEVNVLRLAPINKLENPYPLYLPLDDLRQLITRRQLEAITLAHNRGYYEIPRDIILETLARDMGIKRRTFEDHLRKAEKKIIDLLIPSLMLSA